jgi:alpha-galactosidase
MRISRRDLLAGVALSPILLRAAQTAGDFRKLAPTPPMGWNSWDAFATTIREDEARSVAKIMAAQLLPHGYNIFTIDAQWHEPGANSFDYRKDAVLTMDEFGRLTPAVNRFPSAANGAGFKPLADYVHSIGLKFGIHIMRGVPRRAAQENMPVFGSSARAGEIADRLNVCEWNTDMYGIDMSQSGAQAYYDSLFRLYAAWGVDFVKADDMSRPYLRNEPEIHAVRRAIERCGRPMLLSLSPGETPLAAATDAALNANMWRISDDFWDTWPALLEQFDRLKNWAPYARPGSWPDADMLPLGVLELGRRKTRFTAEEQQTLLTLWCIARSPLVMGGDLRKLDALTLSLLTNDEALAVNQHGIGSREVFRNDGLAAWSAASPRQGIYIAVFNLRDSVASIPVKLAELGISGSAAVRDLWQRTDLPTVRGEFSARILAHGAGLYCLSAASA